MTKSEFHALCLEHHISTGLALENEQIAAALATRNDAEVRRILREEF